MAFKLIVALAFITVASAGVLDTQQAYHGTSHTTALARPILTNAVDSYDSHPRYQYSYSVHDEHTGDIKSHVEARDGDVVRGEYSLIDADGYKRTVQYSADHDHGFNAIVHREPQSNAVKTAPVIKEAPVLFQPAPVVNAAPALNKYVAFYARAPAAFASEPITKFGRAAFAGLAPSYAYAPTPYVTKSIVRSTPVSYIAARPVYSSQSSSYSAAPSYPRLH